MAHYRALVWTGKTTPPNSLGHHALLIGAAWRGRPRIRQESRRWNVKMTNFNQPGQNQSRPVRALGLCSGGLDSILSALILRRQGIQVEWVSFETPFFSARKARKASRLTGIALHVRDITDDYLRMLLNPRAGYGKNMNPCMDCHALMFKKAGEMMHPAGFDFLFSGEVLGQRPMSQNAPALNYVAKHSGVGPFILRPLSARKLSETPMEQNGLVDRERLLDLNGRSRKPQMALAAQFGITDYPTPAGGCLLTDPGYARRLKDLLDHQKEPLISDLHLLKFGRHLRLSPAVKIVVGRTQKENEKLVQHCDPQKDAVVKVKDHPGPTAIMPAQAPKAMRFLAGAICAGYSKAPDLDGVTVQLASGSRLEQIRVLGLTPRQAQRFLIR
jgi:tRNA U34 2-thiouridine synthase MnmA/TrmU